MRILRCLLGVLFCAPIGCATLFGETPTESAMTIQANSPTRGFWEVDAIAPVPSEPIRESSTLPTSSNTVDGRYLSATPSKNVGDSSTPSLLLK